MIGQVGQRRFVMMLLTLFGVGTLFLPLLFQDIIRSPLTITRTAPYWSHVTGEQRSRSDAYSSSDSTTFAATSTPQPHRNNVEKYYDFNGVHVKRKLTMHKACEKTMDGYRSSTKRVNVNRNSLIDQRHHIVYCRVQKAGSTFITGLLQRLHSQTDLTDGEQTELKTLFDIKHTGVVKTNSPLLNYFRFMFTRDPYTRLLSGYVDKLFTANTLYWKHTGTYIKNRKLKPQGLITKCGHDVTFPEFIKYVIMAESTGKHTDRHFTPIYKHCRPCRITYNFIGKMETFKDDSLILVNAWNKQYGLNISYSDFEQETVLHRVSSHVRRLYKMRNQIMKCTSFYSVMKRAWRDFQIRGFLSKHSSFPFTEKEAYSLSESQFVSVLEKIITDPSTDRKALKQQKMEALIQAYSLVPMEDLVRLRKVVQRDCQLFGYSDSPSFIFNRTVDSRNGYQYFDIDY